MEARANVLGQQSSVVRGIQQDHVAADFALQFCRRAQGHQISFIHDGQAVAALGFFHQVRRHQHGHLFFVAQDLQILPQIAAGARIQARRWLIQQQDSGMVQQSFRQFDAALHAPGERFDSFFGAIRKADAVENFSDPLFQRRSSQPVKMSLMPQILVCGQLGIDALRLKHDADLATQTGRILRRIDIP